MRQILLILSTLLFVACSKEQPNKQSNVAISVIDDRTDSFALHPLADPILALYNFNNDKNQEASFRAVYVTDKRLNPVTEYHLESGAITEHIPNKREKQILIFYKTIRMALVGLQQRFAAIPTMEYSECYCTISCELRKLKYSNANKKYLLVFSDLQENSLGFNCYSDKNKWMIKNDPSGVAKMLNQRCPLPNDLSGINIIFVYQPITREQDEAFINMVIVYQLLLEPRGVKVFFQADNKKFNP